MRQQELLGLKPNVRSGTAYAALKAQLFHALQAFPGSLEPAEATYPPYAAGSVTIS
jgi:hypothetical protein